MFELIKIAVALAGSSICGLYDLKTTNMLDWLAIAMIIAGFGLHAAESFAAGTLEPMISWLIVVGFFFAFSLFMYYAGYWGGGDGELLIAIGSLLPLGTTGSIFFSLNFFINSFLVGGMYSIAYAIILAAKSNKIRRAFAKNMKGDITQISVLTISVFFIISFSSYLLTQYFFILSLSLQLFLFPFAISVLFFLMLTLYRLAKVVESKGFYKRLRTSQLKEGDMLGQDLPKLKLYKKLIRGLTQEEIKKIRKAKRTVIVREGVRYGPVFPIALAFTLLYGSIFGFVI